MKRRKAEEMIAEILKDATILERLDVKRMISNINAELHATSSETKRLLNKASEAETD